LFKLKYGKNFGKYCCQSGSSYTFSVINNVGTPETIGKFVYNDMCVRLLGQMMQVLHDVTKTWPILLIFCPTHQHQIVAEISNR
jgi:hypothetical protein